VVIVWLLCCHKDVKKAQKQTFPKRNMEELKNVMNLLAEDKQLSPEKRDHPLGGTWVDYRESHVQSDFLLIYKKNNGIIYFWPFLRRA
jgi:mRNA interferase YafQ